MATQEDRSLSAGVSLPKWMKSRMTDKFDFDQSAFSPTEIEDNFMVLYRNPLHRNVVANESSSTNSDKKLNKDQKQATHTIDVSRHLPPCQKYLQNNTDISFTEKMKIPNLEKVKPNGIDDGFHSEAAKCGSSIIRVANQMVSGKGLSKCGQQQQQKQSQEDLDEKQYQQQLSEYKLQKRRGSKSLPASPLASPGGSPKASRKNVNRYFTNAYTIETEKHKGSWILSNLLARREMSQSVNYIGEESKEDIERSSSNTSLYESETKNKNTVLRPKPSELREMNFWSPTSM